MWWVAWLTPKIFENGASSKIDDVLTEDGGLLHVLPPAVHLKFFCDGQVGWTILVHSYFLNFFVGPLLHALKLWGGWVVVAYRILVSAPVPMGFWVWGLGVDNNIKTIQIHFLRHFLTQMRDFCDHQKGNF